MERSDRNRQRRRRSHVGSPLHGYRQRQRGAQGHRQDGDDRQAERRKRRSAYLPCLCPLRAGERFLPALRSCASRRPRYSLYGEGRDGTRSQIRARNRRRGLRQDREGYRRGTAADKRRDLFGAQVPFQQACGQCVCGPFLPLLPEMGRGGKIRYGGADQFACRFAPQL